MRLPKGLLTKTALLAAWLGMTAGAAEPDTPRCSVLDLGTLGGPYSGAIAVNERGEVAGSSDTEDGSTHAFLWTVQDGMFSLGTLGGRHSSPAALNERGEVAGSSETEDGDTHAFLWRPQGGMIDLGTLGGRHSSAAAMSCHGPRPTWFLKRLNHCGGPVRSPSWRFDACRQNCAAGS